MRLLVAEVAPVGPGLGEVGLAGFLALGAILLCIGALILRAGVAYWLRPMLNGIAWVLRHINLNAWKVHVNLGSWLASQVLKLEHIVEHYLGRVADAMAGTSNVLFHHAGALVRLAWSQLEGLAADVVWAFQQFRRYVVPKLVKALVLSYIGEALLGRKLLKWIAREIAALVGKTLRWVRRELTSTRHTLVRLTKIVAHAGAVAIPRAFPGLRDLIRGAKRDIASLRRYTRALRWLAAFAGIGALTAAILKKAGLRWLTCKNVTRAGHRICRLDPSLLTALIAGTRVLGEKISLEALAREMVEVAGLFLAGLQLLIPELRDAVDDYLGPSAPGIPATFSDYLD